MISLERRDGRPLRIGHRGAATLAPENTLPSFRAAAAVGVDLIELDVIVAPDGELVVAHSVGEMQEDTPTFEDALRFFVDEAPEIGVHVDLKCFGREREVVDALRALRLVERSFVSSVFLRVPRRVAAIDGPPAGVTIPRGVLGISDDGRGAPIARWGLAVLRAVTPYLARPLLALTRADALVMHHSIVTPKGVRAGHARGVSVVTWTVDEPRELERVVAAGVDAVVTNDPRLFAPGSVSTIPA